MQHGTLQGRQAQKRKETDQQASCKSSASLFQLGFLGRRPRCAPSWGRCPCEGNHSHRKQRSLVGNRSRGIWSVAWKGIAPASFQESEDMHQTLPSEGRPLLGVAGLRGGQVAVSSHVLWIACGRLQLRGHRGHRGLFAPQSTCPGSSWRQVSHLPYTSTGLLR